MKYLYIIFGGGFGAALRYLASVFIYNTFNKTFPLGTLFVNIVGCFIMGFLFSLFEKFTISSNARLFIFVGLLGGFTTFSSFGMETFNLLRESEFKYAFLNFFSNNILGFLFVFIGFALAKIIFKD